ncbi:CrcB family protein [Actinoplanes sp. NBRC 101535]|uniref:fluoride efflux transporter FluC n=1 Tax=Actinoplanes sp. NBRC 101535 TaxID=3032196 RepID=UPI0024A14549|nr:CrcB family protein [Actinoplanes sp. NBRC 101535]GLY05984.1 hypothetical protein Acsp01_63630 [Actinoplanes sp. NBRC 101535]
MRLDVDRPVLVAVAAGGALGALARYAIASAGPGSVWTTWLINVSGCFLIGVLYTLLPRLRPQDRLLRPLLGTGVLGGYTTFSTATVEVYLASPRTALLYLAATLVGAILAVAAGSAVARIGTP